MRLITCLIAIGMLAACASPTPRGADSDAVEKRASEARAERELDRACRIAQEQGRADPRCPQRPAGSSRNPNLPLELPVKLPGGLP